MEVCGATGRKEIEVIQGIAIGILATLVVGGGVIGAFGWIVTRHERVVEGD